MAKFTLTSFERSYLISLMNTHGGWDTENARRNFFSDTYTHTLPNLQHQVAVSGGTDEFSKSLLRELEQLGALQNRRRHALFSLLRYLRGRVLGWEHELVFIEELLDKLDHWAQHTDTTQTPIKLSFAELKKIYDEAVRLFGQKQWAEVLERIETLEVHGYTQGRVISVEMMKQRATKGKSEDDRYNDMIEDYHHISALTQIPDMIEMATEKWEVFRLEYKKEFTINDDIQNLLMFFLKREQSNLIHRLRDPNIHYINRIRSAQKLAEIGDPRSEVTHVDNMEFCRVPAGRFWMGSDERDSFAYHDERPASYYETSYEYLMGRYPVTNAQFWTFVNDGGYKEESWWRLAIDAGYWSKAGYKGQSDDTPRFRPVTYERSFSFPSNPIVGITWYESWAFIEWLKSRWRDYLPKDWQLVLPNEPEWEKAARGGEFVPTNPTISTMLDRFQFLSGDLLLVPNENPHRIYTWGDKFEFGYANSEPMQTDFFTNYTHTITPVGCFASGKSPYGCEEMNGNVWEWQRNAMEKYPYENDERENINIRNKFCVLRGGAYANKYSEVRCANRNFSHPNRHNKGSGFRLAIITTQ